MNKHVNLITTYNFRGREYLVNINSGKRSIDSIELKVTDKRTLEEWIGSYDASYIENLTHKTGNYKRFDTFVSMLKSGLLNTSHCVTLDLLTFDDLEMLRSKVTNSRGFGSSYTPHNIAPQANNRRYLIVTYTVEFDRIHYPLALEYCGPPEPRALQETIRRLEKQVADLSCQLNKSNSWEDVTNQIDSLQKKIFDVSTENVMLKEQITNLNHTLNNKSSHKEIDLLLKSIYSLENKLKNEISNVEKLKKENVKLTNKLEEALRNEKLVRAQLNSLQRVQPFKKKTQTVNTKFRSSPTRNRSLELSTDKPFRRHGLGERMIRSARSSINIGLTHSSSEDSFIVGNDRGMIKKDLQFDISPRIRVSSPSLSDLTHNSGISRCACRNCLKTKFMKRDYNQSSGVIKKQDNIYSKAKLMKRIQSLEKLISGIIFH